MHNYKAKTGWGHCQSMISSLKIQKFSNFIINANFQFSITVIIIEPKTHHKCWWRHSGLKTWGLADLPCVPSPLPSFSFLSALASLSPASSIPIVTSFSLEVWGYASRKIFKGLWVNSSGFWTV